MLLIHIISVAVLMFALSSAFIILPPLPNYIIIKDCIESMEHFLCKCPTRNETCTKSFKKSQEMSLFMTGYYRAVYPSNRHCRRACAITCFCMNCPHAPCCANMPPKVAIMRKNADPVINCEYMGKK